MQEKSNEEIIFESLCGFVALIRSKIELRKLQKMAVTETVFGDILDELLSETKAFLDNHSKEEAEKGDSKPPEVK